MEKHVQNNNFYKFSFDLFNVPVAYAKCIKTNLFITLSTVAFNDEYEKNLS